MSNKMLRIAGRTPDNTAKGFSVDTEGYVGTHRKYETLVTKLLDVTPPSAIPSGSNEIVYTPNTAPKLAYVDMQEWATVSLLIRNDTDVSVVFRVLDDEFASSSTWLKSAFSADYIALTAPANSVFVVTPNDLPLLDHLRYIKLRAGLATAPTNGGSLKIYARQKR